MDKNCKWRDMVARRKNHSRIIHNKTTKMQITFKTEKGELLFVKVPEGASRFKMFPEYGHKPYLSYFVGVETYREYVGVGFNFMGIATDISEKQSRELVDENRHEKIFAHYCFREIFYPYDNALDGFKSILQHLGIDFNPIVLFKPNNCF